MIIRDSTREYNTEMIERVAKDGPADSIERDLYREAFRLIYLRYKYIRQLLSDNCCSQPSLSHVKDLLTDENRLRINKTLDYSDEETDFYIYFEENYNQMIR